MLQYPYENTSLVNINGEIWRPVKGLEEYLLVSNKGRIKTLARTIYRKRQGSVQVREKIVNQFISQSPKTKTHGIINQSLNVSLNFEHITSRIRVSRAVYAAFVGKLTKGYVVCHRDGEPFNNQPENLYKLTYKELSHQNLKTGRSTLPDVSKFTKEQWEYIKKVHSTVVSQYDIQGNHIKTYPSCAEAGRICGLSPSVISDRIRGKGKLAGGYIWKKGDHQEKLSLEELQPHISRTRYSFERPVIQYDLEGNYLNTFASTTQAAQFADINRRTFLYRLTKTNEKLEENGYLWGISKKK